MSGLILKVFTKVIGDEADSSNCLRSEKVATNGMKAFTITKIVASTVRRN